MNRRILLPLLAALIALGVLFLFTRMASAGPPTIGCKPYSLTVRTGQIFYFTVAVTDTIDLYAWQFDASYNNQYLEFLALLPGNHLRSDGAQHYLVSPRVTPGPTTNEIAQAANTRLSRNTGVDGNGNLAYLRFRAIRQKTDGISVTLNDIILVDRNALEITESLANSGRCRVVISDNAPYLIQPLVGELLFLPLLQR